MKRKTSTLMIIGVALAGFSIWGGGAKAAEPTVESISLTPPDPSVRSPITFTVTMTSDESLTDVRIIVQECTEGICYRDFFNESMTLMGENTYQTSLTLIHEDATYIKYHVEAGTSEQWYTFDVTEKNLTNEPSNGDGDQNGNGNGEPDESPGFELVISIGALSLLVFLMKRKRCR